MMVMLSSYQKIPAILTPLRKFPLRPFTILGGAGWLLDKGTIIAPWFPHSRGYTFCARLSRPFFSLSARPIHWSWILSHHRGGYFKGSSQVVVVECDRWEDSFGCQQLAAANSECPQPGPFQWVYLLTTWWPLGDLLALGDLLVITSWSLGDHLVATWFTVWFTVRCTYVHPGF